MTRLPRLAPLAVALLLAAGLAGCTGAENSPAATTSPTISGTPTGPGTPTPATTSGTPAQTPGGTPPPAATPPGPAAIEVVRISADRGRVAPGERLLVAVDLVNNGGRTGEGALTALVDGEAAATATYSVAPGARQTVSLSLTLEEAGHHIVSLFVPGAKVSVNPIDIEVVSAGSLELSNLVVTPPSIDLGDSAIARVMVVNHGGTQGTGSIVLRWNGSVVGSTTVDLAPGQVTNVTVAVTPPRGGAGPLRAALASGSAEASTNLSVRAPFLANERGAFRSEDNFCQGKLTYRVDVDNLGDGVARGVVATAVALHPDGTEAGRGEFPVADILPGGHASFLVAPAIPDQCGQVERYSIRVTVAPRAGDAVTVQGGPWDFP